MKWTKDTPTEEGLYFRNNPPAAAVVRAHIVDLDGVLHLTLSEGMVPAAKRPTFWWFGPIPPVPGEGGG